MTRWEPVVMAGLGAAVAVIDPSLAPLNMALLMVRAGVGAAVSAYFGNHISNRKKASASVEKI